MVEHWCVPDVLGPLTSCGGVGCCWVMLGVVVGDGVGCCWAWLGVVVGGGMYFGC